MDSPQVRLSKLRKSVTPVRRDARGQHGGYEAQKAGQRGPKTTHMPGIGNLTAAAQDRKFPERPAKYWRERREFLKWQAQEVLRKWRLQDGGVRHG